MSRVIDKLENRSIYLILKLRGANPGFHFGIFIPTAKPFGEYWHATNVSGGWVMENKITDEPATSMSLCAAIKIGEVKEQNRDLVRITLGNVPADSKPSLITNEVFSCRTWLKDALHALQNAGVINLNWTVNETEAMAIDLGEENRAKVETGKDPALVRLVLNLGVFYKMTPPVYNLPPGYTPDFTPTGKPLAS